MRYRAIWRDALAFIQFLKIKRTQAESAQSQEPNGKKVAEMMTQIADRGTAFRAIDPITWQREIRTDRLLPRREE